MSTTWPLWTLLLVLQAALVGAALALGSGLLAAFGELALLSLAVAAWALTRYLSLRHRLRAEQERHRQASARQRNADDVHDLLGHELSLLALQAGALQLRLEGPDAEAAAALRQRAEGAVETLTDVVALAGGGTPDPVAPDPDRSLAEFRAAGGEVTVHGDWSGLRAPARLVVAQVLRECLTNAARHAPGCPVEVTVDEEPQQLVLLVRTLGAAEAEPAAGTGRGLAAMRRRVEAVGGSLSAQLVDGSHAVTARVPREPSAPAPTGADAPRRPLRIVVREVAVTAGIAVIGLAGFYAWASHGASIEPETQARLSVGMTTAAAVALLPARQAPVRLLTAPTHPRSWTCRSYTNGNVPLAVATLEVCLDGDRVVRVTDLAARPLW